MINGILPINKPKDWTSFDVVNKIKHLVYPEKVGHLGTLDPMATGVLLLTLGKATKLFDIAQQKTKTYLATFKFGVLTDTLDITGNVIETTTYIPTLTEIKNILPSFIGVISQVPPKYSAKSVNGKRAYNLARNNIEFELKPKNVYIKSINIISFKDDELVLDIECGSGTYIRKIGEDIAKSLNSLATMTSLVRTKIDNILLKDCYTIEDLNKQNILDKIIPINKFLNFKLLELGNEYTTKLLNGMTIILNKADGLYILNESDKTRAIIEIKKNHAKMKIFFE